MKVKDLITLLQQQDENAEIGIETYEVMADYDYNENLSIDYNFYYSPDLAIIHEKDKLMIVG